MEKVVNNYETLFIADVSGGDEAAKATVAKFTEIIAGQAEVIEVTEWGKRRLAYLIDDKPEGYYTVVTFKSGPEFPNELERLYNIDENVMRSLVVKLEYEPTAKAAVMPAEIGSEEGEDAPAAPAEAAPTAEAAPAAAETAEAPAEAAPASTDAE